MLHSNDVLSTHLLDIYSTSKLKLYFFIKASYICVYQLVYIYMYMHICVYSYVYVTIYSTWKQCLYYINTHCIIIRLPDAEGIVKTIYTQRPMQRWQHGDDNVIITFVQFLQRSGFMAHHSVQRKYSAINQYHPSIWRNTGILSCIRGNITYAWYQDSPSRHTGYLPGYHSRLIPICNAFFIQRGHRRSLPI